MLRFNCIAFIQLYRHFWHLTINDSIGIASGLKNFYFCLQNLLLKSRASMSYTTKYSSILRHLLMSQKTGCLKFQKYPSVNVSKTQLLQSFLKTSQQNIYGGFPFQYIYRPSWKFSAVYRSYSLENMLAPAPFRWNSTVDFISGIFRSFKNTQG